VYEAIDATAFPSPRLPFDPIHWSWHHQCRETCPALFTEVLHSLREPGILACVSDFSPYDTFRPHSPLGWFVKHFPAHYAIIGRTLPHSVLNVRSHCNVSNEFYSSISRPDLLLVQSNVIGFPLRNHSQTHNGEPPSHKNGS
jgi:hypothetical protein